MIPIMKPTLTDFESLRESFEDILESGQVTGGKYVAEFEKQCAEYLDAKYAVAVSSGTTSLILPVLCKKLSGEVIVPSYSWCASAHILRWNNIEPVFVDIEPDTLQIDTNIVESLITDKTTGILAVHMAGSVCNIKELEVIAKKYNLVLLFDSAHAFGSHYMGKGVGGYGDASCYSLSATKNITTGEGGIITTNDADFAEQLKLARNQGVIDGDAQFIGMNARMSEFHAAIGLEMLKLSEDFIRKKEMLYDFYYKKLVDIPGLKLQKISKYSRSTHKDLTVVIDRDKFGMDRDELAVYLSKNNISTKKYYYPPIHRQQAYIEYREKYDESLPVTNYISRNCLNLPFYPNMSYSDVEQVLDIIVSAAHEKI